MSATKVKLNKKERKLVELMYQHEILKLSNRDGHEWDHHIEPEELTGYLFSHPSGARMGIKRIVYCIFLKSWPKDECNVSVSGSILDGRYVEELGKKEYKNNIEIQGAIEAFDLRNITKKQKLGNLELSINPIFHPTIYTYVIYNSRLIKPLLEKITSFEDFYQYGRNERSLSLPGSYNKNQLSKLIENGEF